MNRRTTRRAGRSVRFWNDHHPEERMRAMAFDSELRGCFGESDLIFAGDPMGEVGAFKWLISLRERGIGLAAAKAQVDEYLRSRGANQSHIQNQLQRVTEHLKPWLMD